MNEILKRITDVGVVAVVRAEKEEEAFKIKYIKNKTLEDFF